MQLSRARLDLEGGRTFEAEAECRRILQQQPDDPDALQLLARIVRRAGRSDLGSALLRKALLAAPDALDVRASLADALLESSRIGDAIREYRAVLSARPNDPAVLTGLAVALQADGAFHDALAVLDRALAVAPADRHASFQRVNCLHPLGEVEAARATYVRLSVEDAWYRQAHATWARRLVHRGRHREARSVLAVGCDLHPDDSGLAFALASLGGAPTPHRAPDTHLIQHFDGLAETFDESLVALLEYAVPRLLADEARRVWGAQPHQPDVLDLGCGTGLCGVEIRDLARRLVGVDLSPRMLDDWARGVYDELRQAELTSALAQLPASFDLILAGDVLIYFGDLQPLLAGTASALRPGGLLALSIEQLEDGDVRLHAGGRYAHSLRYLRETAQSAGLSELSTRESTLRMERGEPVRGCVSVFRR